MDIGKQKRKWLWPLARAFGLLHISFKECACPPPPYEGLDGSLPTSTPDTIRSGKECRCPVATRSVPWLVYSLALVSLLVPGALLALYSDRERAQLGKPSMRMTTVTDELVTFGDILSVSASSAVCFMQAAFAQGSLFVLLAELQQVDRLLYIRPPGVANRLVLWLAFLVTVMLLDAGMWLEMGQEIAYALSYLPFYGLYMNTFVMELLFIDDAHSIHMRFRALNDKLQAALPAVPNYQELSLVGPPEVAWGRTVPEPNHAIPSLTKTTTGHMRPRAMQPSVQRLSAAHHLLCDAALTVARRYGVSLLGDMLCLLLHLVITSYFFFRHLLLKPGSSGGDSQTLSSQYVLVQACWLALHLGRLFMIVLPCSRASSEAGRTGAIVGVTLNSTSPSTLTHKQLETFSLQLLHHKVSFNACGLFELGLPLVVSILGAVTTYLVVLLQLKAGPIEPPSNATVTATTTSPL